MGCTTSPILTTTLSKVQVKRDLLSSHAPPYHQKVRRDTTTVNLADDIIYAKLCAHWNWRHRTPGRQRRSEPSTRGLHVPRHVC